MRRAILAIVMLAAGGSAVADVPAADAIREHIRLAAGPRPASVHVVVLYDARGLHGRRTTYRSGDDFREVVAEGPFTMQRGQLAKQAWHQNANGETVLDQPDPGVAVRESYKTEVREIATPVAGYLIASLNAAGSGTKDYVEAASWHVVRREVVRPSETTTYAYDDFRTVDGVTQAWHWTARDGHSENDAEYRIQSQARDVRASDVAIATSRAAFVEFPAGQQRVVLPVREERDKFYVRVNIGDRGLDFVLDTGAGGIAIDEDVARQLGLTEYGRYSGAANAGRFVGGRVLVPKVAVGDLTMHDVEMGIIPHVAGDGGVSGEVRAVGLLGFDFLGALALKLDYQHGSVIAFEPSSFVAPASPHTLALDIRLSTQLPMTDVPINGALGERFIIDTGASAPLMVFDYFQRRHGEALVDRGGGGSDRNRRYNGVGGAFQTRPYQLDSVRLGTANFKDFIAFGVRSKSVYASDQDGVVGTEFLRLFNVYLNYGESRIYLEPNDLGRAASGR